MGGISGRSLETPVDSKMFLLDLFYNKQLSIMFN